MHSQDRQVFKTTDPIWQLQEFIPRKDQLLDLGPVSGAVFRQRSETVVGRVQCLYVS